MHSLTSTCNALLKKTGIAIVVVIALTVASQAQFGTVWEFSPGNQGANPAGQIVKDPSGNLYIGTYEQGQHGFGTVFQLKRHADGWTGQPLYSFAGGMDGEHAYIYYASNGTIYGASNYGGGAPNCGTVFQLQPSATIPRTPLQGWNETILHTFAGGNDGCNPWGAPIPDSAGNSYGTTVTGGPSNAGTVYELQKVGSGYQESVLYSFNGSDGANPYVGLVRDSIGNLYGVTITGGEFGYGVVFELSFNSGQWVETILWAFENLEDGRNPNTGLIFDQEGNLYGSTQNGGAGGGGTVFKLTPVMGGGYTFTPLWTFAGTTGPQNGYLTLDGQGDIYGTTHADGAHLLGNVWVLTPSMGTYTYTDLYDFTGGLDGEYPYGGVIQGLGGGYYGIASGGGSNGLGTIFEVTP